ncbi:AVAST type 1 anti-phage system MBL fold metallo-hydrolase Avs1a [Microscilla marina]|uniref:Metallo-beta-lactamase superfamily, putative n=1 Tax=Microscilla marina ATCC 23134 TaxID=313606 RepID=A1ZK22_MICM2|nr:AVAST type 1 anti-phage system MBL fold metallo-hydrolase Avs1a [Microscilla marina]EAY29475.1 metallo-beta-lactamase superfamily, putative [Microscilla marina ATCC 23134]
MTSKPSINLNVYPALGGDSMLLQIHYTNILIDGGYVNTYQSFIKDELKALAKEGKTLSHVVVTHIDQDHISGIVKLLEENNKHEIIPITNIWHNSYRHLQPTIAPENINHHFEDKALEAIKGGSYLKEVTKGEKNVSAKQGSSLAGFIADGNYFWNAEFDQKAISTDNKKVIQLTDEIKLILLSPDNGKLERLQKTWKNELRKNGYLKDLPDNVFFDDAFEFMTAKQKPKPVLRQKNVSSSSIPDVEALIKSKFKEDTTSANGSSIAFIIEYDGKRLLFLGDAHPGIIAENIKETYPDESLPIQFDLIKISHHGSWTNNSPDLFKTIDSKLNIFSTNSEKHNHPDKESLALLISRETGETRKLYFNYPVVNAEAFDVESLTKKYNYEIIQGDGNTPLKITL